MKEAYHCGVSFRPSVISYNSQGVHISLLPVQQACHSDTSLKDQTGLSKD